MENTRKNSFVPGIAIPPGDTIRENMIYLGMDQEELAARLGITTKHMSHLINGNVAITYAMALKLEDVIGADADFWLKREINYQLDKARLKEAEGYGDDKKILEHIPYNIMSKYSWVPKTRNADQKVAYLRDFFGVASLTLIKPSSVVMFRKQKVVGEISDYATLAWLRKAELTNLDRVHHEFNKQALKRTVPKLQSLTTLPPSEFFPIILDLCADCGVAVELVEYIPKTGICGASIWRGNKAVVALSLKGKKADIFWFTFFHEIAHLLKHDKRLRINYEKRNAVEEQEADEMASDILIPNEKYQYFLKNFSYRDKTDIISYSDELKVDSSILIGRLMHDGFIGFDRYNDLRTSFEIVRGN